MPWPIIAIAIGGSLLTARYIYKNLPRLTSGVITSNMGSRIGRMNLHGFEPQMTLSEACNILNISITAPKDKIREAYKQLMMRNHPDNGGTFNKRTLNNNKSTPPEVQSNSVPLAVEASSIYPSLKSKATPRDRGDISPEERRMLAPNNRNSTRRNV